MFAALSVLGLRTARDLAAMVALVLLGALSTPAWAAGCSPYAGQVLINEVRVGQSNGSNIKNQVELYNPNGIAQSVWNTWTLAIYLKDGTKAAVSKGTYALASGMAANGPFVYNSTLAIWLQNRVGKSVDIALLDANGDFIDYIAIDRQVQSVPACLGTPTVVNASPGGGDLTGDLARPTDGGAWPSAVLAGNLHTIGRTNECSNGGDLIVSIDADYPKPVVNLTKVTYTVTVFNNACNTQVSSVKIQVGNLSTTNFASLVTSASAGTVAASGGGQLWSVGNMAAGLTATLTISGIPKALGSLSSTASVSAPTSGLVNTSDDSDTQVITAYDANYVGFQLANDSVTEGTNLAYSAAFTMNVPSAQSVTVNYTVSGTSDSNDTDLPASGSVMLAAGQTSASIDFTVKNDLVYEPTKNIVLTIVGITSTDATVKVGKTANNDIPSTTITLYDDEPGIGHYEVVVPSANLACLASTVTVRACSNAASPCTSAASAVNGATVTLSSSAGTLGSTTLVFDASGTASTTLVNGSASDGSTARVTLTGTSIPNTSANQCCPDGGQCAARNYCDAGYSSAGFIVSASAGGAPMTVPTQTAGIGSGTYFLRAVKTNTSTQACEAALSGTSTVNWAVQCLNPSSCSTGNRMAVTSGGTTLTVASNPSGSLSNSTAVTMNFDANGNAPFSIRYGDVGQVRLWASKSASGMLTSNLSGNSNAFIVRPAGFSVSGVRCASYAQGSCATTAIAAPGNNPGAVNASGTAFIPAGQAFTATVTALDAAGNATPNYGQESPAESVRLSANLLLPNGGQAAALSNGTAFGGFASGSATGTTFSWPEVGIITLTPSVADGDYLGTGNVVGTTSGPVGRFVPHHFDVVTAAACGSFSYAGQPFTATVIARNASGSTTLNYDGSAATSPGFAKAVSLTDASALGVGSLGGNALAVSAFTAGVGTGTPNYGFSAKTTSARTLALRATDTDAVSSAGYTEGSMPLRSGRLRLSNAFGSASAALQLPVVAEHWNGSAWVLNSADSCTTVPAASVVLSNPRNASGGASAAGSSASAIALASGSGLLTLAAPTPAGASLSLDIAVNLGSTGTDQSCQASHPASTGAARPWLRAQNGSCAATADRDPAARASFGIFSPESRKTVHVRELY